MPVKCIESRIDVLEATKIRIRNVFRNGFKVYLSFSCGKDSLVMSSITYDLIRAGEIDSAQLTVTFVDEEGLYPSMVEAAERWRKKFLSVGAKFLWLCLPVKQVSVIDSLAASESWITWEPGKEDIWMRQPPPYAIMSSPYLHYPGEMNYQTFCEKAFGDGIQMIGLRTAESLTRLQCISKADLTSLKGGKFYPIYDWKDVDIWLYIKDRGLEFPDIYMRLYEAGVKKNQLRLCCFFGDMSTQGLRWVAETDHELWERIERREPNAYLVLLYWDSEMFRRSSRKRKELEAEQEEKDYRELCKDILFRRTEDFNIAPDTKANALPGYRNLFLKTYGIATQKHYKKMYEGILYGDPKKRVMRILWSDIYGDYEKRTNAGKGAV